MKNKMHLTKEGIVKISEIKSRMNKKREEIIGVCNKVDN